MTVDDIEVLLKDTEHNGYPVVVSRENQYLVGFILRKDLNLAIGKDRFTSQPDSSLIKDYFQQLMLNERLTASQANRW